MHFLSVLTDRVRLPLGYSKGCAPLPDMWKSCVPSCCFVFCTIIIAKFCEKFVNFERIFLYEPSVTQPKQRQKSDTESWRTVQNVKWYQCAKKKPIKVCAPPCLSDVSPTLPLKQSQCHLIDSGPLLFFQGRLSTSSSFHISLLQAVRGVMSLALCPQVVSLRSSLTLPLKWFKSLWFTMALSRPFKEDRLALPLSTPLSSRQSMVCCPRLCAHT